jgi:hypothetical protein
MKRYTDKELQAAAYEAFQKVVEINQWVNFYMNNPNYARLIGAEEITKLDFSAREAHRNVSKLCIMVNGGELNDYTKD